MILRFIISEAHGTPPANHPLPGSIPQLNSSAQGDPETGAVRVGPGPTKGPAQRQELCHGSERVVPITPGPGGREAAEPGTHGAPPGPVPVHCGPRPPARAGSGRAGSGGAARVPGVPKRPEGGRSPARGLRSRRRWLALAPRRATSSSGAGGPALPQPSSKPSRPLLRLAAGASPRAHSPRPSPARRRRHRPPRSSSARRAPRGPSAVACTHQLRLPAALPGWRWRGPSTESTASAWSFPTSARHTSARQSSECRAQPTCLL